MDNRLKLYQTAVSCLGIDQAPYNDEFGCAEALNAIFKKAFGRDIGGGQSTYWLYDTLKNDTRFEKNFSPLPGDIIISPTGYGNKKKLRNGHVGIIAEGEQIMSNNSINGLWEKNYTLITWARRYKIFGGYPVEFFRVKTPISAPTIPAVAYTSPNIVVNPPLLPTVIPSWLSNLIYRTQNKLGNIIWGDRMFGTARDSSWARESKAYLKIHNVSELSGKKGTWTNPLVIHHVIPVSRDKSKEMDKSNWVVLTTWEHLVIAHLGSWLSFNPVLRADIEVWKKKYNERP